MVDKLPASKPKARKITWQDAEAIADLVSDRLTETEACLQIGIEKVSQWFHWKEMRKRQPRFEQLVTRLRGGKLKSCISSINRAGDDDEIVLPNGKAITKRGDWRAKAWLAEQVLAPERFGQRHEQPSQVSIIASADIARALQLAMSAVQREKPVIDVQAEPQQLPPATNPE